MQDNAQLLLRVLELLPLLMQRLKCSTLQTQSLRYYSRRMTSYRSLWYSTNNQKLFQKHLVCHAFFSITFAFRSCLRLVEAFNCHSDWRQTRRNLEIPFEFLDKNRKPNATSHNIHKPKWTIWSDPIQSSLVRSIFCRCHIVMSLKIILGIFGNLRIHSKSFWVILGHFRSF